MSSMNLRRGPLGDFGITVGFDGRQAVLGVTGEVDVLTAPELAVVVEAVIGRGHASVVLDLAEVGFMGAAGLSVIAAGAGRMAPSGGRLVIRSPSALVSRLLKITRLDQEVDIEVTQSDPDRLGPEQSAGDPGVPVEIGTADLAQQLRQLTAIPADNDVIDGALRLVVALARATVVGADGVSVSLRRHGRLRTVAASDQTISDMDAHQYATGEGPCVDASIEGRWFHAESLDTETRWPAFTPRAQDLGIKAILSTPLLSARRPLGALNIYSRTVAAFASEEQALASTFATEASAILQDAGAGATDDEVSERLGEALRARQVIAQAQGVVMERAGISSDDAFTVLRSYAEAAGRPLRQQAEDIVGSAARPEPAASDRTRTG